MRGKVGDNVMYLAHRYGVELEGEFLSEKFYEKKQIHDFMYASLDDESLLTGSTLKEKIFSSRGKFLPL